MSTRNILILAGAVVGAIILVVWASNMAVAGTRENCAIQGRLKTEGYYKGEIDCVIGDGTEAAIRAFQADNGLPQVGRVGPATYKALFGTREEVPAADDYEPEDLKGNDRCSDRNIHASAEGAWLSRSLARAWKAWSAEVAKADGLGLRYADHTIAADVKEECIKASAGARFTKNCSVRARPCRPS